MYNQNYQEYVTRVKAIVEKSQEDIGDDGDEEMKDDNWTWFKIQMSPVAKDLVNLKEIILLYLLRIGIVAKVGKKHLQY